MLSSKFFKIILRNSRALLSAAAILGIAPVALHAGPILETYTYQLTFTSTAGAAFSGTGLLVIQAPAILQGSVDYTVTSFSVMLDPHGAKYLFSMTDPLATPASPKFQFTSPSAPSFRNLQFGDTDPAGGILSTTGGYQFTPKGGARQSGTITMKLIPNAVTPEPSSLIFLGTGLFAGAGGLFRRYKLQRG